MRPMTAADPRPLRSHISGPRETHPLGPLDPRQAAWRPDLADLALAGHIAVPKYAAPARMRIAAISTPLLAVPDADSPMASELLHGEGFAMLERDGDWAWGYATADHYVGYVRAADLECAAAPILTTDGQAPHESHVGPADGLVFAGPSIKAPVLAVLPMGAVLRWREHNDIFGQIVAGPHAGGYVHRRHMLTDDMAPVDWVDLAERFIGAPYRWGGRTRAGIDCSGLVQIARQLAGLPTRRDSDMQAVDTPLLASHAQRGDLACWPGHIGIMLDGERLLHANAFWMACVVEPLATVIARARHGGNQAEPELRRPLRQPG